jgi:anaerobic magnesium-protoporphyrin IX monomethyl ester cyclase
MKVLLIRPPIKIKKYEMISVGLPMSLLYLASVLEKDKHVVKIMDLFFEGWKNVPIKSGDDIYFTMDDEWIIKKIEEFKPDLVGISLMFTPQCDEGYRIAELLKKFDKNIKVIVGGAHVCVSPREVLSKKFIDYVCIGEGEKTIEMLANGLPLNQIPNLGYKKNKKKVINKRGCIEDLDYIPFPALHLIEFKNYPSGAALEIVEKPVGIISSSRGCPGDCVFCNAHTILGKKWRSRSAKNVVDEIEWLVKNYGVKEIQFIDDNVSLDKKRMIDICKGIIDRKIKIRWTVPNGIGVWSLNREVLIWMKKSGCYKLNFGIESGNKQTLKFIGKFKQLSNKKAEEIIKIANDLGIWTHGFCLFGFYDETLKQIIDTLDWTIKLDLDSAGFAIVTPYPGSKLYDYVKERVGEINLKEMRPMVASYDTKYFTKEELNKIQVMLYSIFFKKRLLNYLKLRILFMRMKRMFDKTSWVILKQNFSRLAQIMGKENIVYND